MTVIASGLILASATRPTVLSIGLLYYGAVTVLILAIVRF